MRGVAPPAAAQVSALQAGVLGLGTVLLAVLIRWSTRHPIDDLVHPAGQDARAAAASLLTAATLCNLLWWTTAASAPVEAITAAVLQWMLAWTCAGALASYVLRAGAAALAQHFGRQRRALVVGEGRACHQFLNAARAMAGFPWALSGVFDVGAPDGLVSLHKRVSSEGDDIVVLVSEGGPASAARPSGLRGARGSARQPVPRH